MMALAGLRWGAGWFVAYVLAHVALLAIARPRLFFGPTAWLFAVVLVLSFIAGWARGPRVVWGIGLLVFVSLWMFYLIVMFHVLRSVSIRTMAELVRAPARTLTVEALDRLYDADGMFDHRIDSMVANGYLIQQGERFIITGKGRAVARLARWTRRLLNLQTYG